MSRPRLISRNRPSPEQLAEAARPMTRLEERREELRARFTEMQWDLGGAAYEMAARDYFRLDVLAGMASRLQIVDAELAEIERMARLERAGAAGACAGCGSLHAQGAIYCWRCGRNLAETTSRPVLVAPSAPSPEPVEQGATEVVAATPVDARPAEQDLSEPAAATVEPPGAVEPGPVAAVPTEPVPRETVPTEPMSSETVPAEPAAVEPAPVAPEEPAVPRPGSKPWSGAASKAPVGPAPVMVPPFAGAVEIPTYEPVPRQVTEDGSAPDGI